MSQNPIKSAQPDEGGIGAVPEYVIDSRNDESVRGRVTFSDFYMGNGEESRSLRSVHGGAIALLFDDVLGWISLRGGTVRTRTAYLTVNFRSMGRVGVELDLTGHVTRVEGRKQFIVGELSDHGTVVADVEALFVTPRGWDAPPPSAAERAEGRQ